VAELERFTRGPASVLLATDVAAQGLNLQMRSRWVISFELPWNPLRLEQRAGRVDRIGQQRTTRLTVLIARHEAEAGLLANLARRILTARRAFGDDVFPAAPDEKQIGASLLSADSSAGRDDGCIRPVVQRGPVALCRVWVRPARAEARRLLRLRALAQRWQVRVDDLRRPVWSAHARLRRLHGNATLAVIAVPLLDRRGSVVEQRIVAMRVDAGVDMSRRWREYFDTLRRLAARAAVARATRLTRLLTARAASDIAIDRAIGATLIENLTWPDQPGLFDRRSERARADADAARSRIEHDLRHRIAEHQDRALIRPGQPFVALVLTPRP
jgi:hypothetical protein